MNTENYGLDELLLVGIKSEIDSEKAYLEVARRVKDPFLKGRLEFLANEERKHREFLEGIFRKTFPDKGLILPEKSVIPLPEIRLYSESGSMRDVVSILDDAMKAEKTAYEFYSSMEDRFDDDRMRKTLHYLAIMEMDHYNILKMERDSMADVEDIMEDMSFVQLDGQY